jgi:ABC-2 type transport system permease protein
MKAYLELTKAQLKLFARNRSVIFWTTLFPLFLMVMLGLFLSQGTTTSFSLGWVDEDDSAYSQGLKESFQDTEAVDLEEWADVEAAKEAIETGDLSFVLVVPAGFEEQLDQGTTPPSFEVYYDEVDQSLAEIGFAVIENQVDEINKQLVDFEEILSYEQVGLQSAELTYLDFLVPGITALMILSSNLNGVAAQIASWREREILRRLQSTGLRASTFIAAQITARLTLNGSQAILVLLVGVYLLGAQMNGNWLLLFFYLVLGTLVFMSLGFIIASLAKSPEHAAPIAGFLSFPMFFLGGIFFPISNMPDYLQPVVYILPISHLADSFRHIMNLGAGLYDLWFPTAVLLCWFVICFAVAAKAFKWE